MSAGDQPRRGKCRGCDRGAEVVLARRSAGGSYNRAPRNYDTRICRSCVEGLLASVTPGHWTVNRWDIHSLRNALARFEESEEVDG